ncbi:hypothetical protein SMD44_04481 [Streptomyces alboflavus]|uniref:Uncharacterized protein n=1 Tax=Streptomyces alboflavus TaxID=67267 RepID=A0A1Z1WEY3_9ACTN|nr:hypothetical protein SMD44_04481 [Streptomyces alboflavus]
MVQVARQGVDRARVPSISQSRPMTWDTMSRTDQAGQGVG